MKRNLLLLTLIVAVANSLAQTGSPAEPVRYIGGVTIDPSVHEGRLRWAIGAESIQVMRANRSSTDIGNDSGWTYNHAPFLAYWNNTFYFQYLSNPVDEHITPGQTLLTTSKDGRNWTTPKIVFPPYKAPAGVTIPTGYDGYMMHQRMGFYVAPNGRLLTVAFYGHTETPFQKGGIGRVVREVYKDGQWGPIHFIRYETHAGWNENNTSYPYYTRSKDTGFVAACQALLKDRLMTLQWKDEDNENEAMFRDNIQDDRLSAFSYFRRKDGKIVGVWKKSKVAISEDGGYSFSEPVKAPTLLMSGGKNWGQNTDDGRIAMVYNPIESSEYRYPLVAVTSDDGIVFDDMVLVQGEVPPRRFYGRWKDFGPCYTRGIMEGNGNPPGNDMWLVYSMNKEDMWISRIPLPVRHSVTGPVNDHFNDLSPDGNIPDWITYSPKWAPVSVVSFPSATNKSLRLQDEDPYDYARAIRVFEETTRADISFKVFVDQHNKGELSIDVTDRYGNRPVRISFDKSGIFSNDGSHMKKVDNYTNGNWYNFQLKLSATVKGSYDLILNNTTVLQSAALAEAVQSVERISFRTGPYRNLPHRTTPNETPEAPLPGADQKVAKTLFYIDDVRVQ